MPLIPKLTIPVRVECEAHGSVIWKAGLNPTVIHTRDILAIEGVVSAAGTHAQEHEGNCCDMVIVRESIHSREKERKVGRARWIFDKWQGGFKEFPHGRYKKIIEVDIDAILSS